MQDRITATIAYADIFDYPLTPQEVRLWSIGKTTVALPNKRYMTLRGRNRLIVLRAQREKWAKKKWRRAMWVASYFRWIPSLLLVGVTGGLAMNNVKRDDDIDLFIITSRGTLWTSRLLISILTQALGVRRLPNQKYVTDKICLNMFMAENALALNPRERDLFAAHEILQMRPLWERDGTYSRFLNANTWVKEFLPNAWEEKQKLPITNNQSPNKLFSLCLDIGYWILRIVEQPARLLQLWYMQTRRTSEVIEPGVLRFHPVDARTWVRNKYETRLKKLNLPLDNIFYHR